MTIAMPSFLKQSRVLGVLTILTFIILLNIPANDEQPNNEETNTSSSNGKPVIPSFIPKVKNVPTYVDPGDGSYDFSILIISYHKTGHDLQMDLVNFLIDEFPKHGPQITKYGDKSIIRRRQHPNDCSCAHIKLQSGRIAVQHAPDLFCDHQWLGRMLIGGRGRTDRGVKVVHLVRNPFELAVSNYNYHARRPTPESWVKFQHPCQTNYIRDGTGESYADHVIPTLADPVLQSIFPSVPWPIVSYDAFDRMESDCNLLYQTMEPLTETNLLEHLIHLDSGEGLRLATAEMTIQGEDNGGDILRMANNIIKLKRAENYIRNSKEYNERNKELRVRTFSLDDFIANPSKSFIEFLDFVFDDSEKRWRHEQHKQEVAERYERNYLEKKVGSKHMTHGNDNAEELKEYLRDDPAFGPPLSRIERLVEAALAESWLKLVS